MFLGFLILDFTTITQFTEQGIEFSILNFNPEPKVPDIEYLVPEPEHKTKRPKALAQPHYYNTLYVSNLFGKSNKSLGLPNFKMF